MSFLLGRVWPWFVAITAPLLWYFEYASGDKIHALAGALVLFAVLGITAFFLARSSRPASNSVSPRAKCICGAAVMAFIAVSLWLVPQVPQQNAIFACGIVAATLVIVSFMLPGKSGESARRRPS